MAGSGSEAMRGAVITLVGVSLLLAACGRSVANVRPLRPSPPPVASTAPGQPGQPGQPAAQLPDGPALLARLRERLARTTGVEVEVKASSSGSYYGGKRVAQERSSASRSRMTWVKTGKLRAQVLESSTPMLAGSVLVMTSPTQVRVKGAGALGLVPISMRPTDTRLITNRNHYFTDNHPIAHLQRLTAPGAVWEGVKALPVAPQASWVAISGVRRLDAELTRELLALDAGTLQPTAMAMMVAERPVVTFQFLRFSWDAAPPESTFRL
ncbi:MAG: hypothetical protein VKQ33_15090 [Candidatus Sericytochromatia bacterium]|nr:hypothetical protein [Candidatus Sericytochromatia bacterium]